MIPDDEYATEREACIEHAVSLIVSQIHFERDTATPVLLTTAIHETLSDPRSWPGDEETPEWSAYLDDQEARIGLDVGAARAFTTLAHCQTDEFEDLWQSVVTGYGSPYA